MKRSPSLLVALLLAALALAGCLDDEAPQIDSDEEPIADAVEAAPTEELGSVKGKVVSASIEELAGVSVLLLSGSELAADTQSDTQGRFTLNELEPGRFLIQFSKAGYRDVARAVDVVAGDISEVNVQLEALTGIDLGEPFVVSDKFEGFLGCGVGTAVITWSTCTDLKNNGVGDENDKMTFRFNVAEGLEEVVIGMTWTPVGGVSGTDLTLAVESNGCSIVACGHTYGELTGKPDLIIAVSDDEIEPGDWKFANITGNKTIQIRVFPGFQDAPNVIYQQPFTIYWEAYYNQRAPEGRNPIPEQ